MVLPVVPVVQLKRYIMKVIKTLKKIDEIPFCPNSNVLYFLKFRFIYTGIL